MSGVAHVGLASMARRRNPRSARLRAKAFASLADGLARTPVGETFYVQQAYGRGVYEMVRTATGHRFVGMQWYSSRMHQQGEGTPFRGASPPVSGLLVNLWGCDGWLWDGRLIPNRASTVAPTLNMLPMPFNAKDEVGATPTRAPFTTDVTDSSGVTNFAMKITATAQAQQLTVWRSSYGTIPSDTYRMRVNAQQLAGGVAATKDQWRLGQNSTSGTLVQPGTGSWTTGYEKTLAAFTGTSDVGFSSAVGNSDGVVAIENLCMYDPLAGESSQLPTAAQELAAQGAGHMKNVVSYAGRFTLTMFGSINIDGATLGTHVISFATSPITLTGGYTFGCWIESTEVPTGTQAVAMGFDRHSDVSGGATGTSHGQFGIYGSNGLITGTAYRLGKIYANPNIGSLASTPCCQMYFPNQGKKMVTMTIDGSTNMSMTYNEVPVTMTTVTGWTAPAAARLMIGGWNASDELHKVANPFKGNGTGFFLKYPAMSQSEIHQQGVYMREHLRLSGDSPAVRKGAFLHNGDSLSAFSPSWAWHLSDCTNLSPRLDTFNFAVGGTTIGDALSLDASGNPDPTSTRKAEFLAAVQGAIDAGYQTVNIMARWFTNEHNSGHPWSWIANGSHVIWRDSYYLPFMAELKALSPSVVKIWHCTDKYRLGLAAGGKTEWDVAIIDQVANDDFRDNYRSYGLDYLVDFGLGTERVTGVGTFAPETRPGGWEMANWRLINAHMNSPVVGSNSRAPGGTLTLSAASGSAITATASTGAGTFLYHDLYRKIVAGSGGYGRITAISADGSSCTLNTSNVVPTAWTGEPAIVTTRDTLTRGAGYDATSYGTWSIASCAEEYQTDGIHQSNYGGRLECDRVAATIQAFLDSL